MKQIITSILDNDFYKITMQQLVFHQYADIDVTYSFKCRNDIKLGFLADDIRFQIEKMATLLLKRTERNFLDMETSFLMSDYLDYLSNFKFNPEQVHISTVNDDLEIQIKGPWIETILWEVPLLAIINELYFQHTSDFKTIEG
ncbi:MAG: nicotinate phosphoribosyltransferase, partial [bacterium]